jgi:uncharacterized protein YegL
METPLHVLFIIDSSGSMYAKADDVRGGFNEYVAQLCDDTANTYRLSAVTFDTEVRSLFGDLPLYQVPKLDETNYHTMGNTALYDALGVSIDELTTALKTADKPYGVERALVIIMTDGEENSSRRYQGSQIQDAIKAREAAGNWTFVYLGADQDAWSAAAHLGFAQGNVAAYDKGATGRAFSKLAASTRQYSASGSAQTNEFAQLMDDADAAADKPGEDTPTSL